MQRLLVLAALLLAQTLLAASDPVCLKEDIFPSQSKHVHGSSIVEWPSGQLLACWFYGSGERDADDVMVQGARRDGATDAWSAPFIMTDTPGFPDCNPVLFVDGQKRLWLFWIRVLAHRWECSQLFFRRADSPQGDGPPVWSWQDAIQLSPGEGFPEAIARGFDELGVRDGMWGEYARPYHRLVIEAARDPYKRQTGWMTRIHPLLLPTGRILLPLYSDGFNLSLVALSDDDGQSWRASQPIVGLGPIQPSLVLKQDGAIVAYCRDAGSPPKRVMRSDSVDLGETWSPARDTEIPNPGSSLEVILLMEGPWLMVCNDADVGRHRLSAWISEDEGGSWVRKRTIELGKPGETSFAYPSVIQSRDGLIHATYSCSAPEGKTIRHATLNLAWIMAGE